ncbi:MAG: ribbon-helix-helix domain-containing protein [Candidatus Bathyarchaeia archaeon]
MEIKVEPLIWKKKEKRKSEAKNPRMSLIIVLIPRMMLDAIDDLVHDEVFSSRAETIRASIMLMLIELRKLKKRRWAYRTPGSPNTKCRQMEE